MKKLWTLLFAVTILAIVVLPSPAVAGDCGDRPCSLMEDFEQCLEVAVQAADDRATDGDGSMWTRFMEFSIDVAACGANAVNPFK